MDLQIKLSGYDDNETLIILLLCEMYVLTSLIQIWQIVKGKLECVEVIKTKESIRKLEAFGNMIFVITKGHKMKVYISVIMPKEGREYYII